MAYLIENLHFIVIHVPIAMLIFSFVFDVLAKAFKKREWHAAGLLCLIVGTLGAIAAVMTGPEEEREPLLHTHELFGKITMIFFIALTVVRLWLYLRKKIEPGRSFAYLAAALIGVLLVSYTGHLGGSMVHKEKKPGSEARFHSLAPSQDQNEDQTQDPTKKKDREERKDKKAAKESKNGAASA
ncbi:MAG: hypothetical protein K0R75_830 [Paenibacillaceae bacterium]|jgi:uncharacterized membrane protein|nr:hypothetical protein [Paenibacillaceae bacterium]